MYKLLYKKIASSLNIDITEIKELEELVAAASMNKGKYYGEVSILSIELIWLHNPTVIISGDQKFESIVALGKASEEVYIHETLPEAASIGNYLYAISDDTVFALENLDDSVRMYVFNDSDFMEDERHDIVNFLIGMSLVLRDSPELVSSIHDDISIPYRVKNVKFTSIADTH